MASSNDGDRRYFTIRFPDETEPFCLASLDNTGQPERYVPGEGWVDMPALAGYFYGEDAGADEIDEVTARTYIEQGLGILTPAAVEALRGAPTQG
jgi:hypothetical protein